MLDEEVEVELLRERVADSVTLPCPANVALPTVDCVTFAATEFD